MNKLFKNRYFLLILSLLTTLLYIPVNKIVSGGVELKLPIDEFVPIIPIFVIPYLIGTVSFILAPVIMARYAKKEIFYPYIFSIIIAGIISNLIYILYPTFVSRNVILGNDIFSDLIKFVYSNDNSYNAAPSGHTFFTLINLIFFIKLKPEYKYLFIIAAILIILSTVFTGQHNVLDVISGIVFAGICIGVGLAFKSA